MITNNYICGQWIQGKGEGYVQRNAINSNIIATTSSEGLDFESALHYGRTIGAKKIKKMTFQERGRMLKALAFYLNERKESYYKLSALTGATRIDSWIDIDGGIGTLFAYASLRRKFPDETYYVDGENAKLSKEGTFIGQHIMVPKPGIAIHINAFNFPVWGMLEKVSCNWLAGMPAIVKASEITSFLAEAVVKDIVDSGILPEGALQLVSGTGIGILDHVMSQDVVTFTGSAATGRKLRNLPSIIENSVPFNMEADSLNAIVLGKDVLAGSPDFDIFIKEIRKEVITKTGQKCTAIRRIVVPKHLTDAVSEALIKSLKQTVIGDPSAEGVKMGTLVSLRQRDVVKQRIELLSQQTPVIFGNEDDFQVVSADKQTGAFISPVIMLNDAPLQKTLTHDVECFGPVCTIMPYDTLEDAIAIVNMGKGSLVSTICTSDEKIAKEYVMEAGAYHGRILVLNQSCAKESTGHGSPMPLLTHGGPGRAGGGEEMGGVRGVKHFMQRIALQSHPTMITAITNNYQYGAKYKEPEKHLFRKYFEEIVVGETVITHKRTVTEADIVNFANISWDHFYAHTDATSLEGTVFEQRVAHGYFVLSAAAGLFVDAQKGPVLLNYGLEECRFTKPVYAGMTIGVRLTAKEKIDQEKRNDEDIAKGIVKFLVDVYDESGETVAIATILTMVKKLNQE
ncbi:MAG: phenylacetic acid degradation bifunctional protein PaaZ [Saprospiraceae bacterium]|nr:phenylacetic acid degradation bifunctional protein PaaZ [Saprospiraceae bacterium]